MFLQNRTQATLLIPVSCVSWAMGLLNTLSIWIRFGAGGVNTESFLKQIHGKKLFVVFWYT